MPRWSVPKHKPNADHVIVVTGCMECRHCGESRKLDLPVKLPVLTRRINGFVEMHRDCMEGDGLHVCQWCGNFYAEHNDKPPKGGVARTPCGLLKSGFVRRHCPEGEKGP